MHIQDQRSSGVAAQTLTINTWNTRELNTILTNEITSATLATHVISLPGGTYFVDIKTLSSAGQGLVASARLYNNTASAILLSGANGVFGTTSSSITAVSGLSCISGRIVLAGTSLIKVEMYSNFASGGNPMSIASTPEIYTDLKIWKVL